MPRKYTRHIAPAAKEQGMPNPFVEEAAVELNNLEEVSTMSEADYKSVIEQKDNALNTANTIIERQRQQLDTSNKDYQYGMRFMHELNENTIKYYKAKEDAQLKVLEGLRELMSLDRIQIEPKIEREND